VDRLPKFHTWHIFQLFIFPYRETAGTSAQLGHCQSDNDGNTASTDWRMLVSNLMVPELQGGIQNEGITNISFG
jgi:hypothetical protein